LEFQGEFIEEDLVPAHLTLQVPVEIIERAGARSQESSRSLLRSTTLARSSPAAPRSTA